MARGAVDRFSDIAAEVLVDSGTGSARLPYGDHFRDLPALQRGNFDDRYGLAVVLHDDLSALPFLLQDAVEVSRHEG